MPFSSNKLFPSISSIRRRIQSLTLKKCRELTGGGLQFNNSKMPSYTYGSTAKGCITGSKLQKIKNSVCSSCYALNGNYRFPSVDTGLTNRLKSIQAGNWEAWTAAQVKQIDHYAEQDEDYPGMRFFRWHDSGDLQSVEHFQALCVIADMLPDVRFWLPTRELQILKAAEKQGITVPFNLIVRVSQHFIGRKPWKATSLPSWAQTSTVNWKDSQAHCPAYKQEGKCLTCRSCWDSTIPNTNYPLH